MKQRTLASSLILTATTVAIALQGCNPGSTLAPIPNQEAGGDQGTGGGGGGATSVGGGGGAATNGGTTTTADGGAKATGGTPPVGTGGTPPVGTGGTPPVGTGGFKAATGGYIGVATGGNPPSATGGNIGVATGGNPPMATGGNPPAATGGSPVTTGTGGAASLTSCTFGTAVTVTTSDGYVSTAPTASNGTCGGYSYAWTNPCAGTGTAPTISPCTDPLTTKCPASITVKTFSTTGGLCTTGSVPTCSDYSSTVGFGFNVNQATGSSAIGTISQTGTTGLKLSFTGTKPSVLRAQVSDNSGTATGDYCFDISAATSPVSIPWASFKYGCWTAATAVALPATALITKVQLIIPSDTAAARSFTNLCITGVATY